MMFKNTQGNGGGRHRKVGGQALSGRNIGLAALAAGVVSTAGVGGAAAAAVTAQNVPTGSTDTATVDYTPVADAASTSSSAGLAPQILPIAEYKPVMDAEEHLNKVVQYNDERLAATLGPKVVKPAQGTYTSGFEMRWGTFHAGVDIANAAGTPIVAAMDGVVINSGPASGFGQWIRIQHDDGTITVYGHMNTLDVAVGEHVTAGQQIAGMGSQGFSTGDHLHFEVHPAGSAAIDPVPWLQERGITL